MPTHTVQLAPLLTNGRRFHLSTVGYYSTQLHDHDFSECFWVIDGRGEEWLPAGPRPLAPGDYAFVRPSDQHAFTSHPKRQLTFCNLAFDTHHWQRLLDRYNGSLRNWFADDAPRRGNLGPDGLSAIQAATLAAADRRDIATLDRLLLTLDAVMHRRGFVVSAGLPRWLAKATADHATLRQGVDVFIESTGYTHEHVARLCRKHLNLAPTDLVNHARLDHAAKQLEAGNSVADAAYDAGFGNLAHFHKLFKQRFATTPRRYQTAQQSIAPAMDSRLTD